MGLFDPRPAEAIPAVKRLRKYLKANPSVNVTFTQIAYATQKAIAMDNPGEAGVHNALAESVGLSDADKAAADAILGKAVA